jgi:hypothetical protein
MSNFSTPIIPPIVFERAPAGTARNSARIGTPVMGVGQWRDLASAQNWLIGTSGQLGWWGPRTMGVNTSTTYRTYAWPRPGHRARLWAFVVSGVGAALTVGTLDFSAGVPLAMGSAILQTFLVTELVDDVDPAGEEISVVVNNLDFGAGVAILSVTCSELPLAATSTLTEQYGVDTRTCVKGAAIMQHDETTPSTSFMLSAAGVARMMERLKEGPDAKRRMKAFDWHLTSGLTRTNVAYANIFRLDPSCQTRRLIDENVVCAWAVYASASASAGEVRCTTSAGGGSSHTLSIVSPTPAWYTGVITLPADSMDEDAWINGGVRQTLTFEHRASSGSVTTYGLAVGEPGS